jgi:flagellar biosynthesis anti-sigma factor FlgM
MPIHPVRRNNVVIHNDINALNSITNVAPAGNQSGSASHAAPEQQSVPSVDRATLSAAGTGISQSSGNADVRWEKVAEIRQALADGTYNVPASAVASSIVDSMLGKRS